MKLLTLLLLSCSALLVLPGCVVWEIRDELRGANKQLGEVQASLGKLDETNQSLVDTNKALAQTNKSIDDVQAGLARIDTTNGSLDGVDKRLAVLTPIQTSLNRLDQHLAALRRTIGRIDSVIPFLDLGGGEPVTDAGPVAAVEPAEGAKPEPAEAGAKREAMVGAWLSQFPERRTALIVIADGHYIRVIGSPNAHDAHKTQRGTWKRDDAKTLQFTPELTPGTDAQGKPTQVPGTPWTLAIVSQSGRALTAEIDGQVMVFSRP